MTTDLLEKLREAYNRMPADKRVAKVRRLCRKPHNRFFLQKFFPEFIQEAFVKVDDRQQNVDKVAG